MPEGGMMGGDDGADGQGSGGQGFEQQADGAELSEEQAQSARAASKKRWNAVFANLNRDYGIDLREMVKELLDADNSTKPDFLCMPALVPLDKHTKFGPLFVVGTPLLDSYYARWAYPKDADSPTVHLAKLEDAKVCQDHAHVNAKDYAQTLMRKESKVSSAINLARSSRGPVVRRPKEIAFPHWAMNLL